MIPEPVFVYVYTWVYTCMLCVDMGMIPELVCVDPGSVCEYVGVYVCVGVWLWLWFSSLYMCTWCVCVCMCVWFQGLYVRMWVCLYVWVYGCGSRACRFLPGGMSADLTRLLPAWQPVHLLM